MSICYEIWIHTSLFLCKKVIALFRNQIFHLSVVRQNLLDANSTYTKNNFGTQTKNPNRCPSWGLTFAWNWFSLSLYSLCLSSYTVFYSTVFCFLYPIGDCAKPQCDGSADDSLLPQVCLFVDCTNILGLFCLAESFRERAAVGQKLFGRNFSLKKRWLTRKCFEGNH